MNRIATLRLAAAFAWRDLRRATGFAVFVACIALGVAAIGGVASLARALGDGLAAEGRTILGGDLEVSLVHRDFDAAERRFLDGFGPSAEVATLRAMARRPDGGDQILSELKAVDGAYPLLGQVELEGGGDLAAAFAADADGRLGVVVDRELAERLGLGRGDLVEIGRERFRIADFVASEPDRLSGGIGFGPRTLMSLAALDATGLVQPGSLVRWHRRIVLADPVDDIGLAALARRIDEGMPQAGWRVTPRTDASPGLARNIERFGQFLTLIGLAALAVGGVGVANAVAAFVERKRPMIATLRALGAGGALVFACCLIEVLTVALVGVGIGLAVAAAMPPVAAWLLAEQLPVSALAGVFPLELAIAAAYGIATTLAFSLWPLGRVLDVAPTALFRDDDGGNAAATPRRRAIVAATGAAVAVVVAIAVATAADRMMALAFLGATVAAMVVLRLAASAVMAAARRAGRPRVPELRLALSNIHRRGALTPTVVLSLGLGLTVVVTLALVDANLRRELTGRLPETAPSFFFLDVRNDEADAFRGFLAERAPGAEEHAEPMLRGRLVSLKGIPAAEYPAPPSAEWVLRGDRGITYADTVPEGSRLVAGEWWPEGYDGPPLVSVAADTAEELGLAVGDRLTVNVLGREIGAEIANLREVDWQALGINFFMVFSPSAFAGAPYTVISTLTFPDGGEVGAERTISAEVGRAFPTVTVVRVKDALASLAGLLEDLALAAGAAAGVAVAACVLVLAGALAASQAARLYDAAILRTLGATRRRIVLAFGLELALLAAATAVIAVGAGIAAAWAVTSIGMGMTFAVPPLLVAGTIAGTIAVAVGAGLAGVWGRLGGSAAVILRRG